MWTDSNGKHIIPEKCWRREGTKYERMYTFKDVKKALDANRNTNIGCILISCGANDIEEKSGVELAQDIIMTIKRIKQEHPQTKIVLSEVTPFYRRDQEVRVCNELLHKELVKYNVFLVSLNNLRDDSWSKFREDRKHIKENYVPIFASNLIAALKPAHNIAPRFDRRSQLRRDGPFQQNPRPLMDNIIQNGPSIGQRLMNIADGRSNSDPKHTLISKLTDVIKCLQVW